MADNTENLELTLAANVGATVVEGNSAIVVLVSGIPVLKLTQHASEGLAVRLIECAHEIDVVHYG